MSWRILYDAIPTDTTEDMSKTTPQDFRGYPPRVSVKKFLGYAGEPVHPGIIAAVTDHKLDSIQEVLDDLTAEGVVVATDRSGYFMNPRVAA